MKKVYLSFALLMFVLSSFGQALIPTSWSFAGTAPTGWTTSGTSTYSTAPSAMSPPSCKLSGTGQYVQIYVADEMGPVTYFMKANTTGGAFQGTFTVQESVNGSSWTTLHAFGNGALDISNYVMYTDNPLPASRYIRFYFTNKVSGWNVGLDSITISTPLATPAQEINVSASGTNVPSNGTYYCSSPVSTPLGINLTVENLGTSSTLTLSSAVITGSSDFVVNTFPSSVTAGSTGTLSLTFTPSASGTINSTLTIGNNDASENPYIINLYGVGGSFATEPTAQPTSLNFTNIKSYRFNGSFSNATPSPDGYIILRKKGAAVTEVPSDGMSYTKGDYIGAAQVVSSGTANTFSPNNIVAGSTYHFAVYSYNGPAAYRNYMTSSPLTGNVSTLANMIPAGAYSGISTSDTAFIKVLHDSINPHFSLYYSDYEESMINHFESRDTTGGMKVVTCVYSGLQKVYTDPWDWTTMGFSREHSMCQSWMPTYASLQGPPELPEYNDQHNLFPVHQDSANAWRSNYPLGKVVTVTKSFHNGKFGVDSAGHNVYEPRDEQKGDAARAMFYMCVCYNGVSGNNWRLPSYISSIIPYGQDENVLKTWHWQDPPDAWEIARNDFIDSIQGNRNPFIDSVNYVCYIDFKQMKKLSNPSIPCYSSAIDAIAEHNSESMTVYPNPSQGRFFINADGQEFKGVEIKASLMDLSGKKVWSNEQLILPASLDFSTYAKGMYLLELKSNTKVIQSKIVLE